MTALVCAALAAAVIILSMPKREPGLSRAADRSIAVLPFENLNRDPDNEFFTAGIHEDVLTAVAKLVDVKVISPSSARTFKPSEPRNLASIGQELKVRHVLEGSVRRAGDHVRINVHLLDTRTGAQLWSERYESDLRDIFAIQSDIAQRIADQLRTRLDPETSAVLQTPPTRDMVAYDLYLRAKEMVELSGLPTNERTVEAVKLLHAAIARDPNFFAAHCLLARTHVFAHWSNYDHTPARLEEAHRALDDASRIRPHAPELHLARGIILYWGHRDFAPAMSELLIAQRELPNDADVPYFIGLIERRQGKWEESTRHLEEARTMDPRNETMLFDLARTNYFALKRYREAAEACEGVLAWKPNAFNFALARAKVDVASRGDTRRWHNLIWGEEARLAQPELLAAERLDLALAERDYTTAEELLRSPLPNMNWAGYVTSRAYYEGMTARGLGREEEARAAFTRARDEVAAVVASRPDDAKAHIVLAQMEARLHHVEAAVREAREAMRLRPPEKDAVDGPNIMGMAAGVFSQVGQPEAALDLLERVARMPIVTNFGALQLDDAWDSLQDLPRFRAIKESLVTLAAQNSRPRPAPEATAR